MITRLLSYIRTLPSLFVRTLRAHPRTYAVSFLVFAVGTYALFGSSETVDAPETEKQAPRVSVASLGALQSDGKPIALLGEVRSVSQAELRAQKSGKVTQVYVRAGQTVGAGTVLAEIDNASERAAVLQAQGAVAGAQAGLARVQNGARSEDRESVTAGATSATVSLAQAKESARTAFSSAYSSAQDAILAKSDTFLSNPYTVRPSFRVNSATYDEQRALEDERVALTTVLETWKTKTSLPLSDTELDSALSTAQSDLDRIKRYLDRIAYFISKQEVNDEVRATDIALDNALILGARQSIDGARASITGARTGLASAQAGYTTASLAQNKITTGERSEDVDAAQAGVLQARGILAGAQAMLENTLIRTPIAGTVTSLSIAGGDFVSMQQNIAVVANPGAQEIVAFVSEDVRATIAPGMQVLVDGQYEGVITSADPGLDPVTKRARITIGVPKGANLTNGSFVEVAVRTDEPVETQKKPVQKQQGWYIPISAIKVLPSGLVLFTLTDEQTLKAVPIHEGTIVADRMLIQDALEPDLRIVQDVRGRIEGEQVTIAE